MNLRRTIRSNVRAQRTLLNALQNQHHDEMKAATALVQAIVRQRNGVPHSCLLRVQFSARIRGDPPEISLFPEGGLK
jgi:hypothetical protein